MAEKTIMAQKLSIACENRFWGIQETWETERPNKKTGSEFFWKKIITLSSIFYYL